MEKDKQSYDPKQNYDKNNVENIGKMIEGSNLTPYGIFMNESGNGERPNITDESRKRLAKSLIRGV